MFDIAGLDTTHSPIPEEGDEQCKIYLHYILLEVTVV